MVRLKNPVLGAQPKGLLEDLDYPGWLTRVGGQLQINDCMFAKSKLIQSEHLSIESVCLNIVRESDMWSTNSNNLIIHL